MSLSTSGNCCPSKAKMSAILAIHANLAVRTCVPICRTQILSTRTAVVGTESSVAERGATAVSELSQRGCAGKSILNLAYLIRIATRTVFAIAVVTVMFVASV